MTTPDLSAYAEPVQRLHAGLLALEHSARFLSLPPLNSREWFQSLEQKLLPQLRDDAFLVVAVVGGTNIGKSVIFNHIAGAKASAVSPLASGTKHPVCLVPPGFEEKHDLDSIFHGFELVPWSREEDPLSEDSRDRLFWRTSDETPASLLILDTPDIDSDAQINWERADKIRRSADVLLAILTQQKYNDAAVKQFFRKAAAEDKAVIVVFNQCQLPDDEEYWPLWLETFCRETGVRPEFVYVAPNDRRAAEQERLPFYERQPLAEESESAETAISTASRNLSDDLARLRFGEIKLRTLRGSLKLLIDAHAGVPGYLREVQARSAELRAAAEWLASESVVKIRDWPNVPNAILVAEIRKWWKSQQQGWSKTIHGFYNTVGQGVTWPIRYARERLRGPADPPMEDYRHSEWSAMLRTVEELYERLSLMSESGNELLRPHFEKLLAGTPRGEFINRMRKLHAEVPLESELEDVVTTEMRAFQSNKPGVYAFYRRLNDFSAAARPMASVVLFTIGWGPAGHMVAPLVVDAMTHGAVQIVADFAGGAAAAMAGETAISSAAGTGMGMLQAKFQSLQASYTARRAGWLAKLLKDHLLGSLPEDLAAAAGVPGSESYRAVTECLRNLEAGIAEISRQR